MQGTKLCLIADSNTAYVLQCYFYEGAKYDPSSKVAGSGYDVVICLMEMAKCFNKGHHLFTDNLFTAYAAAGYLLERGSFLTGTMGQNQLYHLPNEITVKPKVGQEIYFRQDKFLAMLYRQKQLHNEPVIMLSTFCSAFDVPDRKKENKVVPAMVDLCNQNMGGVDSSDQVMYFYAFERKSKSWSKKVVLSLLTHLLMNSYILYKLTVAHPKTRLEFRNQGIANLPGKKEKDCIVCSDRNNPAIGCKRSRTVCTKCDKGVHAKCSLKHKCL